MTNEPRAAISAARVLEMERNANDMMMTYDPVAQFEFYRTAAPILAAEVVRLLEQQRRFVQAVNALIPEDFRIGAHIQAKNAIGDVMVLAAWNWGRPNDGATGWPFTPEAQELFDAYRALVAATEQEPPMSPHVDRNAPDVTLNLPPASLTQGEREELRRRHSVLIRLTPAEGELPIEWCRACGGDAPCPTLRALDALEAAERREDALVEALQGTVSWPEVITAIEAALRGHTLWVSADKHETIAMHDAMCAVTAAHDARQKGAGSHE